MNKYMKKYNEIYREPILMECGITYIFFYCYYSTDEVLVSQYEIISSIIYYLRLYYFSVVIILSLSTPTMYSQENRDSVC